MGPIVINLAFAKITELVIPGLMASGIVRNVLDLGMDNIVMNRVLVSMESVIAGYRLRELVVIVWIIIMGCIVKFLVIVRMGIVNYIVVLQLVIVIRIFYWMRIIL
jgi:hypothetical protein